MTATPERAEQVDLALRRVHRGVLATLAVCALVILATGAAAPGEGAVPRTSLIALALALGSVLARRAAPAAPARRRVPLVLASLLLAAGVGLLGAVLAVEGGPRETSLLYVLGAGLLCLRSPAAILAGP